MQSLVSIDEDTTSMLYKIKNILNYVFLFIYHVEFIIKALGLGVHYFDDSWNKLDLSILVITDMVLACSIMGI